MFKTLKSFIFKDTPPDVLPVSESPGDNPNRVIKQDAVPKKKRKKKQVTVEPEANSNATLHSIIDHEKKEATAAGNPWVQVLNVELDPNNIGNGAFTLDWNEIFVAKLIRVGYKGKTDSDIVDQWFQDVCRNIVMSEFEQEMADPEKREQFNKANISNSRSEIQ